MTDTPKTTQPAKKPTEVTITRVSWAGHPPQASQSVFLPAAAGSR